MTTDAAPDMALLARLYHFQSEEHVRVWSGIDRASTAGIRPLADSATGFSVARYRERLAPDYPLCLDELSCDLPAAVARLGCGSPFRQPAPVS